MAVLEKDQKLIAIMVDSFIENQHDIKFVYPCCAFLDSIEFTETLRRMISMAGGLGALNYIIRRYSTNSDMVRLARSLLAKITSFVNHTSQQPTATATQQPSQYSPSQCPIQSGGKFTQPLQPAHKVCSTPNLARHVSKAQASQATGIPISSSQSSTTLQHDTQTSSGPSFHSSPEPSLITSSASKPYYLSKSSRSTGETSQCCIRQSTILSYSRTDPDYYITFDESLAEANFINTRSILKHINEVAAYLSNNGTLKKYSMSETDAKAMYIQCDSGRNVITFENER